MKSGQWQQESNSQKKKWYYEDLGSLYSDVGRTRKSWEGGWRGDEEEGGDGKDKVNFGSCTHSFTPHPFGIYWPHTKLQSLEED